MSYGPKTQFTYLTVSPSVQTKYFILAINATESIKSLRLNGYFNYDSDKIIFCAQTH